MHWVWQFILVALYTDIEIFHFFPGPGRFSKEGKARLDAGIVPETPDVNDTAQIIPSEMLNEFSQDHFQRLSMKGIFWWHNYLKKGKSVTNLLGIQQSWTYESPCWGSIFALTIAIKSIYQIIKTFQMELSIKVRACIAP